MKRHIMQLVYAAAGAFTGYLYWRFSGSKSTEGIISSNLLLSVFFGALIGFLLWGNMFFTNKFGKNKKHNSLASYSKNHKSKGENAPTPLIHID
jgi:hypothetical protein